MIQVPFKLCWPYCAEDERTLSSRRRIKTKKLTLEDTLDPSVTRAEQLPPDDAVRLLYHLKVLSKLSSRHNDGVAATS